MPKRKSQTQFVEECLKINPNLDYSKVNYTNSKGKITIICPKHGDFEQIAGNHVRGNGCPKCKRSKGEEQAALILQNLKLNYKEQYSININKCKVIVDFYIPEHNTIIEFNGIQHHIPVKHFGGELRFNKQIKRDELLRNYCQHNNINLIEITYQDNIK